jgi:hypothetical protein
LVAGQIHDDLISDVALFVLSRNSGDALSACLKCLEPESVSKAESLSIRAAVALLQQQTLASWGNVCEFLHRRPDVAARVLGEFAHGEYFGVPSRKPSGLVDLNCEQIGQLVALLDISWTLPEALANLSRGNCPNIFSFILNSKINPPTAIQQAPDRLTPTMAASCGEKKQLPGRG